MQFANDFHSWLRHSWKSLANRLTRDPKIVIHGNSCIILYIQALLRLRMATHLFVVPLVDWVLADLAHMLHPLSLKQSSEMSQIHKNWWICHHKTKFSIGVCKLYIWKRRVVMIRTFSLSAPSAVTCDKVGIMIMSLLSCGIYPVWVMNHIPDSKVHGANMGPTWVLSAPDGPHVGLMNLAIRNMLSCSKPHPTAASCRGIQCGLPFTNLTREIFIQQFLTRMHRAAVHVLSITETSISPKQTYTTSKKYFDEKYTLNWPYYFS